MMRGLTCSCLLLIGLQLVFAQYVPRRISNQRRRVSLFRSQPRYESRPSVKTVYANHVDPSPHQDVGYPSSQQETNYLIQSPRQETEYLPSQLETNYRIKNRLGGRDSWGRTRSQVAGISRDITHGVERAQHMVDRRQLGRTQEDVLLERRLILQQKEQERKLQALHDTQLERLLLDKKLEELQKRSHALHNLFDITEVHGSAQLANPTPRQMTSSLSLTSDGDQYVQSHQAMPRQTASRAPLRTAKPKTQPQQIYQAPTLKSPTPMSMSMPLPQSGVVVHPPKVVTAPQRPAVAAAPLPAAPAPLPVAAASSSQQAQSEMWTKSLMATLKAMGFTQEATKPAASPVAAAPVARAAAPLPPRAAAPAIHVAAPAMPAAAMPIMGGMGPMPGMTMGGMPPMPPMRSMSPMGPMGGMGPIPMGMMSELADFDRPDHMGMGMGMRMGMRPMGMRPMVG